jgi:hypothetical protein
MHAADKKKLPGLFETCKKYVIVNYSLEEYIDKCFGKFKSLWNWFVLIIINSKSFSSHATIESN